MLDKLHFLLNVLIYFLNFGGVICVLFIAVVKYDYFELMESILINWNQNKFNSVRIINNDMNCRQSEEEFNFTIKDDDDITNISEYYYYKRKVVPYVSQWCQCGLELISGHCTQDELINKCVIKQNISEILVSPLFEIQKKICIEKDYSLTYIDIYNGVLGDKNSTKFCIDSVDNVGTSIGAHQVMFSPINQTEKKEYVIEPISTFGVQYIGFKSKCKSLFEAFTIIEDFSLKLENFKYLYVFIAMFLLFYCLFFLILMREVVLYGPIGDLFLIIMHLMFICWFFCLTIGDYLTVAHITKLLKLIIDMQCSDKYTMIIFVGLLEDYLFMEVSFFRSLVLFGIMFIISLAKIGVIVCKWFKMYIMYYMDHLARIDHFNVEIEMLYL